MFSFKRPNTATVEPCVAIDLAQLTLNFDPRCALWIQNFIIDCTSLSARAEIRTSVFNRCNDATMRTRGSPSSAGVFNPRAVCGPRASFMRPGKSISQNTMRYEYWSLSHYYVFTGLTSRESASKIIAWRRYISPLYPLPPSLALSHSFSRHWGINLKQRFI